LSYIKINILKSSKNLIEEFINYTWKEDKKTGEFFNEPVTGWNHLLDALRYVAVEVLDEKPKSRIIVR